MAQWTSYHICGVSKHVLVLGSGASNKACQHSAWPQPVCDLDPQPAYYQDIVAYIIDDDDWESWGFANLVEDFSVILSSATAGATIGSAAKATVTIYDNVRAVTRTAFD